MRVRVGHVPGPSSTTLGSARAEERRMVSEVVEKPGPP
ncbi:hypothetical protein SCAB_44191 [Streptomyces scabiei 87.22]|uniref:Uncharacterized protein n=1 Tax=Streptomyces scabiei (strain 87.22) TaxID=680198 RepID=C9Z788_STRSW|nr:hypothetical protein SCAB_44191 [Streptomyces scabiei 87.22]